MKSHVWRPLVVVLAVIAVVLVARKFLVPADFGIGARGYMYGWHRPGNEQQWKEVKVKYKTAAFCKDCHRDKYDEIKESPHRNINCENCHGPALNHPDDPKSLTIDRSRELCARCHTRLPYPNSSRGAMKGIDPKSHNVGLDCVTCHWPHDPRKEGHKR
ncbi:cytochrome c3 family protein [Geomonas nitrogeniifigens]|uniref:Cytochrome c3 family protein n=1 Tax=Geomonas diazotrophica TaxID=2843197 RepID=A0ABX8JM60_9BACT|nr:cytochrome c3 family protein [Geomonas nitrogeniifigens]QWV98452.1 cytochrome c3 family protein [Geomonas nitrogeniifigens]QXE87634.1 cytochrome c3 family protein [Geomonas nitrogeniifigens]